MQLFDTHTHFDVSEFDADREALAVAAKNAGVDALVLIGFLASRFDDLYAVHEWLNQDRRRYPRSYFAPGLHPFYIEHHQMTDLDLLEQRLQLNDCVAIGEIGLDTFLAQHKDPKMYAKQQQFFHAQLDLAVQYDKPVLLHIRKAHANVLKILKQHRFKQGGIAHAFSGGVEEAKAFVNLGFKVGVTGQITNPNAKKLHRAVHTVGLESLVIETDCPDMTPLCCQQSSTARTRNTPANLVYVYQTLVDIFQQEPTSVAAQLWHNTQTALKLHS